MEYDEKYERFKEISESMSKDLKPIFDRLSKRSDDYMDSKSPMEYTEYVPPCGITERNIPLTEEQIREADDIVDHTISTIMDNPDDFPEIEDQVPQRDRQMANKGESSGDKARVRLKPIEFPEWLEDIESNLKSYFVAKKIRKGLDYEEMVKGVIRKAREKAIMRDSALYVFIDTSGSMWYNTDKDGVPLIKSFASFFPAIAEKYSGEVWMTDSAPYNDPNPIKVAIPLSDFRADDMNDVKQDINIIGGEGTNFWGVWRYFDKIVREAKEKNDDAKIMMIFFSDMDENLRDHPELIHGKDVIFVTDEIPPADNDVMQYINGKNIRLIATNERKK